MRIIKKKNNGYSLIELLIVVGILAILIEAVLLSVNIISNSSAKKVTNSIDLQMKKVRLLDMSKEESYSLYIYKNNNHIYYKIDESHLRAAALTDGEQIANSNVKIVYYVEGKPTGYELGKSYDGERKYLEISYNKSTDAFDNKENYNIIDITGANKKYEIKLVNITGKHFIK